MTRLLDILYSILTSTANVFIEAGKSIIFVPIETAKSLFVIAQKTANTIMFFPWLTKCFFLLLAVLAPIAPYVHFLIFLLVADAITAIYYQFKINKIKIARSKCKSVKASNVPDYKILFLTVESRRLRTTFEKLVAYILGIIVCYFFDTIILQITPLQGQTLQYFSVANISVVLICSVELTSILANLSKITRNPIYNTIARIFTKKISDKIDQL